MFRICSTSVVMETTSCLANFGKCNQSPHFPFEVASNIVLWTMLFSFGERVKRVAFWLAVNPLSTLCAVSNLSNSSHRQNVGHCRYADGEPESGCFAAKFKWP